MKGTEFERYAVQKCGISSNAINGYANLTAAYINPTIIEERALNVASMDVFSRLMMDRILVLGTEINNDVANIITAQLLYLTSQNPTADITLYLNTPGGSVSAGLSIMDTMNLISPDVATTVTGMAASMGSILLCSGAKGKRATPPRQGPHPPAARRSQRTGVGHPHRGQADRILQGGAMQHPFPAVGPELRQGIRRHGQGLLDDVRGGTGIRHDRQHHGSGQVGV